MGAQITCNSLPLAVVLGQQTQGCALQWEGISPYQNAGELAFWNGVGSIWGAVLAAFCCYSSSKQLANYSQGEK